MLSLLKKKTDAAAAVAPAWHPNFRNYERLPDVKQVRTAFFVNGAAIFVALVVLTYFTVQEYQLHNLSRQIEDTQRQIDRDRRPSDQAVALHRKFQEQAGRVAEIEVFLQSRPAFSPLILRLGATLPPNISLQNVELRDIGVALRGTARGAPDAAAGYTSAYIDQLRSDPVISPAFEEITPTSVARNPQSGRVVFEVFMKYKPTVKEAKKS